MTRSEAEFVAGEVEELLDAGPVGLYEFVDTQKEPGRILTSEHMQAVANEALTLLLSDPAIQLVWQRWADGSYSEDASGVCPRPQDWRTPTAAPYLAVAYR